MRTFVAIVFGAFLTFGAIAQQAEASRCRDVRGPFASILEMGPGCRDSPLLMCTHGILSGDVDATYEFSFVTFAIDPQNPARSTYTGKSVITFRGGRPQLFGDDTGQLVSTPAGSTFETTVLLTGGTEEYTFAYGQIVARGSFDPLTGKGDGGYTGSICRGFPNGCAR